VCSLHVICRSLNSTHTCSADQITLFQLFGNIRSERICKIMALFDICYLAENVPEFKRIVLDKLSVKDIHNLAKVSKKHLDLIKKMSQRDKRRFETFVDRVSKAHVEEKELLRIKSTQGIVKTNQALVALNEDNSTVDVMDLMKKMA